MNITRMRIGGRYEHQVQDGVVWYDASEYRPLNLRHFIADARAKYTATIRAQT